jgi:hypothetical protein
MGILSGEEIKAEELGGDGIPVARGSKGVEGVHLVLETVLVVINLLEIINDFDIALD